MSKLPRIYKQDMSGGVQAKTTHNLAIRNQSAHILNGEVDSKVGAITGRKGSLVQSTVVAGQEILGLYIYRYGTTRKFLALCSDGAGTPKNDLYVNASANFTGVWSKTLQDLENGVDGFGENFMDKFFFVNGYTAQVWDGSTWVVVTNAPADSNYLVVFNQRLYAFTKKGFMWYSDVVNSTGLAFTTDSWTSRGINPNEGDFIKMAVRHRGNIIIFKGESVYRFDGSSSEPEPNISIGTTSSKSIVILGNVFFFNSLGINMIGAGDPVLISIGVQKYIEGMNSDNWPKVSGGRDKENVYFWIGDVTINDPHEFDYGKTYSNVVLKFNTNTQVWTVYTGWDARCWCYDKDNGNTYFGTSAGKIVKINTDYADVDGAKSTPINFEVIFTPEDNKYPERTKQTDKIVVTGKYNSDIQIASSFDNLKSGNLLNNGKGMVNEMTTYDELWISIKEQYDSVPPRIDGLIIDNINLLDDNK